ncbi:MAG: LysR family transcriptional regulator [Undibacterium sp.]|uniref:LysR family transcriptional regulator n=1 Tax=Undibacterium sp. TaxID=1914977 RepID=UPI002725722F|nr:LysR family transcriptional regulator [Undibacterium sp.]MDO8652654.1 LysR family transcriptional regulator [Undibacterium sp.]
MVEPKDIDLNLLVVFHEVFQARQISSVAKKLGLSQPAVSNALARLRKSFADELFVRTAQGMQPTPLAEQLADPIANALGSITSALNQHEQFDAATSKRRFTLAMTDVGEVYFMPVLVDLCRRLAPQIGLATVRASSIDLKAEMETGRVDLAIGAFDDISGALYQRRLFQQNYVCMLRSGHPLAAKALSLKDFLAAQHLIVASMESPYDKINQQLEKAGIKAGAHFTVPHFVAVPYIVSSTDLLVTVPQKLAERAAAPFNLQCVKPPLRLPSLQTNIFWHRRFAQDEGNQWLRNFIAAHFAE